MRQLKHQISDLIDASRDEACALLGDLISYPSVPGAETEIQRFLAGKFGELGLPVKREPISESLKQDPEYSFADEELFYDEERTNLVVPFPSAGEGPSIIVQAHVDVVPAEESWKEAFTARLDGDEVLGRGACDDKGQIIPIYLAFKALGALGIRLGGRAEAHLVIEEENGGNGALSLIRQGYTADGVLVMEPTKLQIHPANRGAVWFRVRLTGKSVHMGRILEGVSAIEKAVKVIRAFTEYEKVLVAESKGYRLFERYEQPVQLNVGMISGGVHPSTVPSEAVIEGGVGFLPNKSMDQVKADLRAAILAIDDSWLREHFVLDFPKLHNDSYEFPADHPLPVALKRACDAVGIGPDIFGWNVSCDARLYARLAHLPTVVFGPGDIADAHSTHERIGVSQMLEAAKALSLFLMEWCGTS